MNEIAVPLGWEKDMPMRRLFRFMNLHQWMWSMWRGIGMHEDMSPVWFELERDETAVTNYLDFGRLAKVMSRTTSDNDAEALTSVRQGNTLIRRAGSSWAELCLRLIGRGLEEEQKQPKIEDQTAEQMLESTLKFLLDTGKINEEMYYELVKTIRLAFRSQDTGFQRKVRRRIGSILRGVGRRAVGSARVPEEASRGAS